MSEENIIGMKLIDAIKEMPDDIEMCIGAGRAFMFCGNRNDFYKDIERVNRHQIEIAERKMKKAYNGILKKFKEIKTSKVSIESLRKKAELLEELFEEYYKYVKYLMGYGRIEERKIESVKNRIHKNSIAIIIRMITLCCGCTSTNYISKIISKVSNNHSINFLRKIGHIL